MDLKDDKKLIEAYEQHHKKIPSAIQKSILDAGITNMEIYRVANRLFMMMETTDEFSLDEKAMMDDANADVQAWEELMWNYQQALPFAKTGEKWMLMNKIFDLKENV